MTIDEALERLHDLNGSPHMKHMNKSQEAIQLGIEALKRIQSRERIKGMKPVEPLPGETEK
jgi:hypothetical protein